MNELEKNIIDLDIQIKDMTCDEVRVYAEYQNISKKKESAVETLSRYDRKINRIKEELKDMKIRRLSMITVPVIGCSFAALVLVSGAPLSLAATILLAGAAFGYRIARDSVQYDYINSSDDRLLCRLFPNLRKKESEMKAVKSLYEKQLEKVNELTSLETKTFEEHNRVSENLASLITTSKSLKDQYFDKIKRGYLPYYSELGDVINKTISNPQKFYTNICNGLNHKERRDIIGDISDKTCENCTNTSCKLSEEEKTKITDCNSWYNEVEIGISKVLRR